MAVLVVIGATTGYDLCWLVVLIIPMLAVIQAIAASVGAVCQTGLQGAIRQHYGMAGAIVTLLAVAIVNLFTLAADIRAGGEALGLLTGRSPLLFIVPFAIVVGWLLISHSYNRIERYLSILPLVFVCYIGSAILARASFAEFLRGVFAPHVTLSPAFTFGALAVIGTTLTSYVYIWESIEVGENGTARASVRAFKTDAVLGMLAVGVIFLFIVATSAATLGAHHVAVDTAAQAAATLKPLAGAWSSTLFGVALLGSAILAVPVLASTSAYVAARTFGWNGSLNCSFNDAKAFYGVIVASLAIGALAAFAPVSPIAILYWASIAGGLATPITLVFLVRIAADARLMGSERTGPVLTAAAWGITAVVVAASVVFLFTAVAMPQ